MATDDRTNTQNFPRPHTNNTIAEDFARIITLVNMLDAKISAMDGQVAGKAEAGHTHAIAGIAGLQAALDAKQAASWRPALGDLSGVNVAGAASGQFLGLVGATWQPVTLSVAWGNISGKPSSFPTTWGDVSGKPTAFSPSTHGHAISEIASLQAALDAKASVSAVNARLSLSPTDGATQDVAGAIRAKKSGYGAIVLTPGYSSAVSGFIETVKANDVRVAYSSFYDGTNYTVAMTDGSTGLILGTNGASRVYISATGNVGIGTSSPTTKLDVAGDANVDGVLFADYLSVRSQGGDEGAEMRFEKPSTNSTLGGDISLDVYRNSFRIGEVGGLFRGASIDITSCESGVGSEILHSSKAGFAGMYETPQQTFTLGGGYSFFHGLGRMPRLVQVEYECVSDDGGFVTGQRIMAPCGPFLATSPVGLQPQSYNTTSISIRMGNYGLYAYHAATGAMATLTPASWRWRARVWA